MTTSTPKYLIGGRWDIKSARDPMAVINPATETPLYDVPCCGPEHAEEAISIAQQAYKLWSRVPGFERAHMLRRIADEMKKRVDELARAISTEMGRPISVSINEARSAAEQFHWYAGEADRLFGDILPSRMGGTLMIRPEPVGVVTAFTPWNFPVALPVRKIAPALAAGCVVILRPSEQTPLSAMIIGEACLAAGLPAGVLQILQGEPLGISPTLMASETVRKISFTGSTRVGKHLMREAAETVKRVSMELGGHAPVIVGPDVDVRKAATLVSRYKFLNAGQVCGSPNRFYLHKSVAAEFTEVMLEAANAIRLGDPLDPSITMGPLAIPATIEKVERLVADATEKGAKLLTGGGRSTAHNIGYYFEPTVLGGVSDNADIMHEEPFGPVAVLTTYSDLDDAITRANNSDYGLCAYAFTSDYRTAQKLSSELSAGMVGINDLMLSHLEAPFAGIKHSGVGYESGQFAVREYLHYKTTHYAPDIPA